jgi:HK97 family phage major capsid protein
MNEKEFEALVAKVGEAAALKIKAEVEAAQKALDAKMADALKDKATKEEIKSLIDDAVKGVNDAYTKILKEQGEAIGELKLQVKSHNAAGKKLTFSEALEEAILQKKDELEKILKDGKQDKPFTISVSKAAVTMGDGTTIGSGSTQYTLTENTGIISPIRRREERYLQSVSVGSISNLRALWIEEQNEQGTPVFIAEASGKIQLSSIWVEKTASVKKIGVFGKVTTELMADLPQLISYIKNSLMKRLSVKVEDQLINGDNTGNNLNGAVTLATAFSAGANANAIQTPNEFDVLSAIALQAEVAFGIANAVYIHPSTWAKMKALKNSQGTPIWKDYVDPATGEVVYDGMKIITTTAVTPGNFVGGDMTVLHVLYREDLNIQIGLDGSDFTNNLKTILVESRLVQFASANDTPVIVQGDFATAKTALQAA